MYGDTSPYTSCTGSIKVAATPSRGVLCFSGCWRLKYPIASWVTMISLPGPCWASLKFLNKLSGFELSLHYRSGMVNSNTVNLKFHLIQSYCEIFVYNCPNISCLKCTVNSNFHLIWSKTLLTNDFKLTVPDLYCVSTGWLNHWAALLRNPSGECR